MRAIHKFLDAMNWEESEYICGRRLTVETNEDRIPDIVTALEEAAFERITVKEYEDHVSVNGMLSETTKEMY